MADRETWIDVIGNGYLNGIDMDVTTEEIAASIYEELEREGLLAVKVKPLEWECDPHLLEEFAKSTALTAFGRYFSYDSGFWGPGVIISTGCSTESEAKAAAQADYERRILSALATEEDK